MADTKMETNDDDDSSSSSDDSSDSDDDDDDDDKMKVDTAAKTTNKDEDSSSEDSSSSSDEESTDTPESEIPKEQEKKSKKRSNSTDKTEQPAVKKQAVGNSSGENVKLYVRGLPWAATEDQVKDFFANCGMVQFLWSFHCKMMAVRLVPLLWNLHLLTTRQLVWN